MLSPLGLAAQPTLKCCCTVPFNGLCISGMRARLHGQTGLNLACLAHPGGIGAPPVRRMVVVLEKRTMVYALETLELLTTLDTHPNPKASQELWPGQQEAAEHAHRPHTDCALRLCAAYLLGACCLHLRSCRRPA